MTLRKVRKLLKVIRAVERKQHYGAHVSHPEAEATLSVVAPVPVGPVAPRGAPSRAAPRRASSRSALPRVPSGEDRAGCCAPSRRTEGAFVERRPGAGRRGGEAVAAAAEAGRRGSVAGGETAAAAAKAAGGGPRGASSSNARARGDGGFSMAGVRSLIGLLPEANGTVRGETNRERKRANRATGVQERAAQIHPIRTPSKKHSRALASNSIRLLRCDIRSEVIARGPSRCGATVQQRRVAARQASLPRLPRARSGLEPSLPAPATPSPLRRSLPTMCDAKQWAGPRAASAGGRRRVEAARIGRDI